MFLWNCIILAFCFTSVVGKPSDGLHKVSPRPGITDNPSETVPDIPTPEENLEIMDHLKSILSGYPRDKSTFRNRYILSGNGTPRDSEDIIYDGSESTDKTWYSETSSHGKDESLSIEKSSTPTPSTVPVEVHKMSSLTDSTGSNYESTKGNSSLSSLLYHSVDGLTTPETQNDPACLQKQETGVCRAYIERWHYNSSTGTCNKFVYGGCKGNQNNFVKEYHCYAKCTGEVPCPTNPAKVCKVPESACLNASCPAYPAAECFVLPCTCKPVFEDGSGNVVDCNNPIAEVYEGRAASGEVSTIPPVRSEQERKSSTISGVTEPHINSSDQAQNDSASESTTEQVPTEDSDIYSPTSPIPDQPITDKPGNGTVGPVTSQVHTVILSVAGALLIIILVVLLYIGYFRYKRAMNFNLRTRYAEQKDCPAERECFTSKTSLTEDYGTAV